MMADKTSAAAVAAAMDVMEQHIVALNAHDEPGLAATLHFPHYRLSGTHMKVWDQSSTYFSDFRQRAGDNWSHSAFEDIQVVRASKDKVHLDAEINRFDKEERLINRFRSLWVITHENGRWGARMRSSFAAT